MATSGADHGSLGRSLDRASLDGRDGTVRMVHIEDGKLRQPSMPPMLTADCCSAIQDADSPRHRDDDGPAVGAHSVTTLEQEGPLTQDPHPVQDGPVEDHFVDIDGVAFIDCVDLTSDFAQDPVQSAPAHDQPSCEPMARTLMMS